MGFSAGGIATLEAVQLGGAERLMEHKFKAAIAYYPNCSVANGDMAVPTLILIGELDDSVPSKKCREMMTQRSAREAPCSLTSTRVLVTHLMRRNSGTAWRPMATGVDYNAAAADQSISDARAFLKGVFGG